MKDHNCSLHSIVPSAGIPQTSIPLSLYAIVILFATIYGKFVIPCNRAC